MVVLKLPFARCSPKPSAPQPRQERPLEEVRWLRASRDHCALVALALTYVRSHGVADDIVQKTWVAVLADIDRFEGRSASRTWILRILVNAAITRGGREARPYRSRRSSGRTRERPRWSPKGSGRGRRVRGPLAGVTADWSELREEALLGRETLDVVKRAIEELPVAQRRVIAMRDIAALGADEVCDALGLSARNQRVPLHRARSPVRAALEVHLDG